MFSCEFGDISKDTFFTEHLWTTAFNSTIFLIEIESTKKSQNNKETGIKVTITR